MAYWVMTQAFWLAALKTDGPITGNITGSCYIHKQRVWLPCLPSYCTFD